MVERKKVTKKENKKNDIKNIFQTIILIGAITCIIYGLYTLFVKDNKKAIKTEQIQLKDVKILYNYLSEIWPDSPFHENDRITLSSLNENVLFSEYLVSEKIHEKTYETEGCSDYMSPCKIATINYDELLTKLKNKYGNVNLTSDTYIYNLINCKKEDNNFVCYITLGGIEEPYANLSMITNYIETDEKIDIYDKYIKYVNSDETAKCYIDNSMTVECNNQSEFNNDLYSLKDEQLLEKYGQEYIHTFLKDKDGKYYWYSSSINK